MNEKRRVESIRELIEYCESWSHIDASKIREWAVDCVKARKIEIVLPMGFGCAEFCTCEKEARCPACEFLIAKFGIKENEMNQIQGNPLPDHGKKEKGNGGQE